MTEKEREFLSGFGEVEISEDAKMKEITSRIAKAEEKGQVKNEEKVKLGEVGNLEFYVYPYRYPSSVWVSTNHKVQKIDKYEWKKAFGLLNRVRYYIDGSWTEKEKKERSELDKKLINAYNSGLKRLMDSK